MSLGLPEGRLFGLIGQYKDTFLLSPLGAKFSKAPTLMLANIFSSIYLIVAARHEGGVTIKYLLMDEKNYILLPHNTNDYDSITIPLTAPNPIIGKVAWWWGKAK